MKPKVSSIAGRRARVVRVLILTAAVGVGAALALAAEEKPSGEKPYKVAGTYVEGCSCTIPCSCPMTGFMKGCQGVGAISFTSGTFNGQNLAGLKVAAGIGLGEWVRIYIDAKDAKQREAATEFATTAFSSYGKVESVKDAKIELTGQDGKYVVSVDGGKVMQLTTEPVLGLDKKTPISHSNINDPFNPTIYQGKTVSASYEDDAHSFTLAGSNSYFNPKMTSTGKL